MDMCIGFYMHRGGSFKAKYYRKLTRCVEVMYPPHVGSMFHTPPLYMCRNIHCTFEGLHGQKCPSLGNISYLIWRVFSKQHQYLVFL